VELIDTEDSVAEKNRQPETVQERPGPTLHDVKEEGQTLLPTILWALAAVVLIFLLVLFARWVYHATRNNTATTPPTTVRAPTRSSTEEKNQARENRQSDNQTATNNTENPSNTGNNSQLPNGGPGDIAAIFAGSSFAAAALHYIVSLRRQARMRP